MPNGLQGLFTLKKMKIIIIPTIGFLSALIFTVSLIGIYLFCFFIYTLWSFKILKYKDFSNNHDMNSVRYYGTERRHDTSPVDTFLRLIIFDYYIFE